MASTTVERCDSCGAPIIWARSRNGKQMPLDAAVYAGDDPRGLFAIVDGAAVHNGPGELHVSHFATCPYVVTYRR